MKREEDSDALARRFDERYEKAVLEFLDKEMGDVRPTAPSALRGGRDDRLDAAVSHMLKQALRESDQVVAAPLDPGVPDGVFDEFPPVEVVAALPLEPREPEPGSSPEGAAEAVATATPAVAVPAFCMMDAPSERKGPLLAIAAACALILAGIGFGYYQKPAPKPTQKTANAAVSKDVAEATDIKAAIPAAIPPAVTPLDRAGETNNAADAPQGDGGIMAYAGELTPAELVERVEPAYPENAPQGQGAGAVTIDLVIDAKGAVTDAVAVDGPEIFRDEAVAAAMRWRYRPATLGGAPVTSRATVTMTFKHE
ncbi:MAG: energy transducer TonB [Acidobacteriota bacterium]|jgi:TonB family protein|nr:energy transducer TonB [Acidobacteriota bacterium]